MTEKSHNGNAFGNSLATGTATAGNNVFMRFILSIYIYVAVVAVRIERVVVAGPEECQQREQGQAFCDGDSHVSHISMFLISCLLGCRGRVIVPRRRCQCRRLPSR